MLDVYFSAKFKKDYKLAEKQGRNLELLFEVVDIIASEKPLDSKYKDHSLSGKYKGHRELHLQPDWLLIYKIDRSVLILSLTRMGTHSELF